MKVVYIIFLLLFCFDLGFTQQVQDQNSSGEIIELKTTEIKITVEKPGVILFSERIKPDFDDVNLEKSFIKEIIGEGERFSLDETYINEPKSRIDINSIINRKR